MFGEKQSNGLLLNNTASTIRPGSLKSILRTKASFNLVTKDIFITQSQLISALIYNMLHGPITASFGLLQNWKFEFLLPCLPLDEDVFGKAGPG